MRSALILAVILAALPVGAADLRLHECRTLPGYLYTLTEAEYDNLSRAASEMGSKGVKPFTHTEQAFFLDPDLKVWASEPTADGKIKVRLFGTNQVYWTTQRAVDCR